MAFKDKLRELLDERDMKPAELAKKTNLSESIISYYLSGKKEPMGKTCISIAAALNVTLDELLESPFVEKKEAPTVDETAEAILQWVTQQLGRPPKVEEMLLIEKAFNAVLDVFDGKE